MTAKTRATRAGFTLVEVLMVIAIIAILAALLFAGLGRVRSVAKRTQAANDITQLATVAGKGGFKDAFGIYPPSHVTTTAGVARFMVPTHLAGFGYGSNPVMQQQNDQSLALLQRMFPRWTPTDGGTGSGVIAPALTSAGKALDCNQCLLYFLGGPNLDGWDVGSPYPPPAGSKSKKGPFFDFPTGRVAKPDASIGYDAGNDLPNFLDPWGVPYAYFASSGDNYDARTVFPLSATAPNNDYTTSTLGLRPVRMGGKWVNPGSCQIFSAGPNQKFGPGSYASATSPAVVYVDVKPGQSAGYSETDAGEDDIANFNEGTALGTSNAP